MMGRLVPQEALSIQLRLGDFIPPDHLLCRIDQVLCFDDSSPQLAALYSPVGPCAPISSSWTQRSAKSRRAPSPSPQGDLADRTAGRMES